MDLYAYQIAHCEDVEEYVNKYYGEVPRIRGVRFMKLETKIEYPQCEEDKIFNEYVGTDTIYIHTRCGDCGLGYDDEDSNYFYCGAKDWEEKHKDLFLEHITEEFDKTYCTHYFKAIINEDYNRLIEMRKLDEE